MSIGRPACSTVSCRTGPFHASSALEYPRIFSARKTTSKARRRNSRPKSRRNGIAAHFSRRVIRIDANVALGQVARPDTGRRGTRVQRNADLNLFLAQLLSGLIERGVGNRYAANIDVHMV